MSLPTEEEENSETMTIGGGSKPSRLELVSSRFRRSVLELHDRARMKLYPKVLGLSKKLWIGSETYKILLLGLAAVAFVLVVWCQSHKLFTVVIYERS